MILQLAALLVLGGLLAEEDDGTKPVPDEATQRQLLSAVREVYKEDYDKAKTPAEKSTLAKRLLRDADKATIPNEQFVLLRVARDIAAQAADIATALQAVDTMADTFRLDGLEMKVKLLDEAAESSRSAAENKTLAECSLEVIEEAVADDRFDLAKHLVELAVAAAAKGRNPAIVKHVGECRKEVDAAATVYAKVVAAQAKLKESPADLQANAIVGRHLCLNRGDWEQGLSLLSRGEDGPLKKLAENDLAAPAAAAQQAELADGWWDAAESEQGLARRQLRSRAAYWYGKAEANLTGLAKLKAERRLAELAPANSAAMASEEPAEAKEKTAEGRGKETAAKRTSGRQTKKKALPRVVIVQATLYSSQKRQDVTALVQAMVDKDEFRAITGCSKAIVNVDIDFGEHKRLGIAYRCGNQAFTADLGEDEPAIIPPVPAEGIRIKGSQDFEIVAARFGAGVKWMDVTSQIKELVRDPGTPFRYTRKMAGQDPAPGSHKFLVVWFNYRGLRFTQVVPDRGTSALLPAGVVQPEKK